MKPAHQSRPPLVVIDMQVVFGPGAPWEVPGFLQVSDRISELLARVPGPAVFTRFVPPPIPQGSWRCYYDRWAFAHQDRAASLFDLAPPWQEADVTQVSAPTFSKWTLELKALLGGAEAILLCGVATDCCVLATALAAIDDGATVCLVADACAGVSVGAHQRAVQIMEACAPQVEVLSGDDVCRRWGR